jgi:hypothetical protein
METFSTVIPTTIDKYGAILNRLLVSVIRFIRGWDNPYEYILTETQTSNIRSLYDGLEQRVDEATMISLIHALTLSLFSHVKHDPSLDKYFSAVTRFLALLSIHPTGHLLKGSRLSQHVAALVYANRTAQLYEMNKISLQENIGIYAYVLFLNALSHLDPLPPSQRI